MDACDCLGWECFVVVVDAEAIEPQEVFSYVEHLLLY